MTDSELLKIINTQKETGNTRYKILSGQFSYFEKELKKQGLLYNYSGTNTNKVMLILTVNNILSLGRL